MPVDSDFWNKRMIMYNIISGIITLTKNTWFSGESNQNYAKSISWLLKLLNTASKRKNWKTYLFNITKVLEDIYSLSFSTFDKKSSPTIFFLPLKGNENQRVRRKRLIFNSKLIEKNSNQKFIIRNSETCQNNFV